MAALFLFLELVLPDPFHAGVFPDYWVCEDACICLTRLCDQKVTALKLQPYRHDIEDDLELLQAMHRAWAKASEIADTDAAVERLSYKFDGTLDHYYRKRVASLRRQLFELRAMIGDENFAKGTLPLP